MSTNGEGGDQLLNPQECSRWGRPLAGALAHSLTPDPPTIRLLASSSCCDAKISLISAKSARSSSMVSSRPPTTSLAAISFFRTSASSLFAASPDAARCSASTSALESLSRVSSSSRILRRSVLSEPSAAKMRCGEDDDRALVAVLPRANERTRAERE